MTDLEIKQLENNLWTAADKMRASAHLAANKYGQPILGIIFLRYADILYKQHKTEIDEEYNRHKGKRTEKTYKEISIEKCGFYLPECAYFDYINDAPDNAEKANLVKKAMEAIEEENEKLVGVLPKEVYEQLVPEEEPELLSDIFRIFKDIPEDISIDLFGEIYEYFLGNFALAEGKDGGTFYTPASVVRYMVDVINPEPGDKKFIDPACGSCGMGVQTARYMHNHNASETELMKFRFYGVEKEPDTVKLGKMNLLLNNIRGEITEANSFYSDPYNAVGNFDYCLSNPPFNVNEVVYERVKDDDRFSVYGIPKNKTKTSKKKDDKGKKETVPNANYLWVNYFISCLKKETGRGGFVMANSASDAGKSEQEIRKKIIEDGVIKQMVSLPSNMFSSVTLPATLWFIDKSKKNADKKDEILFIDARNVFTQIDRAHRKFSDEQIKNLSIITRLYEGDTKAFKDLMKEYEDNKKKLDNPEYWQQQIDWLNERFPEGKYQDVIGLCKVAKIGATYNEKGEIIKVEEDSIADQDWSLNPGRYVGVVIDDDGMSKEEFKNTIKDLNNQLNELNKEAKQLENEIFYFKDGNLIWLNSFDKNVNSKYVFYWLRTKFGRDALYMRAIGSAQPAITIDMVKKYKLLVPNRNIQDLIVNIISAYDSLIELNNNRIKLLEQTAQEIYKEWFVRFRFPGCEKTKFEDGFPKEWKIVSLGDNEISTLLSSSIDSFEGEKEFIPTANIQGTYIVEKGDIITYNNRPSRANMQPFENTVWFAKMKESRKLLLIDDYHKQLINNIILSTGFSGIEVDKDYLYYLFCYLCSEQFDDIKNMYANGSTQEALNNDRIVKIKLLLPNRNIAALFGEKVKPVFEEINNIRNANDNLIKQRDYLLPRLMSGKLEVK